MEIVSPVSTSTYEACFTPYAYPHPTVGSPRPVGAGKTSSECRVTKYVSHKWGSSNSVSYDQPIDHVPWMRVAECRKKRITQLTYIKSDLLIMNTVPSKVKTSNVIILYKRVLQYFLIFKPSSNKIKKSFWSHFQSLQVVVSDQSASNPDPLLCPLL